MTRIQHLTSAARVPADRKTFGQLSYPVAPRRQSPEIAEHDLRAKMPFHRFQRLYGVLCGPHAAGVPASVSHSD
ncbi:MAG: hypothetical protein GDA53_04735 [Rhodobacteraceae bacterium]|nr:hypothetical protein [Paracoccaceae bacterium]